MMKRMSFLLALACGPGLLLLADSAQAQLAKSGSFEGVAAWSSYGELTKLPDGGSYWHGGFNGAFVNGAGSGFLHEAALTCPGAGAKVGGRQFYEGMCVLTDADGDQAMLLWNCELQADGICPGPQTWVAGTGKYEGISGKTTFEGRFIGGTPQGVSRWRGEWRLP